MTARAALLAAALSLCAAQDNEAPPAIAQWGIANYASRIQLGWPGGSIARGSLVRIRGWRMGSAANLAIRATTAGKAWSLTPLSGGDTEVEALVPNDAPLGDAQLHVVKNGQASLDWPVTIVATGFGALSRNHNGWGPGEIFNADGAANSEDHPARPGEIVRLRGTGLGAEPIRKPQQVLLAGKPLTARQARRVAGQPGVDELTFDIPADAPAGCYVPVEAMSVPGIYSNAVTLAISRGGPCGTGANALATDAREPGGSAVAVLAHGDVMLELSPTVTTDYPMDAVYASFLAAQPGEASNPIFLSPPPGSCTPFTGPTKALFSLSAAVNMFPGAALDAGKSLTIDGPLGSHETVLQAGARHFLEVIGGHSPAPGAKVLPPFLVPGEEYAVAAAGGADVTKFHTIVRGPEPIVWTNRAAAAEADRARGINIEWRASPHDAIVAILVMNADSLSGNLGAAVCTQSAAAGSFHVPPYALANIPPTPARPRGFPLNLIFVIAFPQPAAAPSDSAGLARITAFAASASGRSVRFH